MTTTHQQVTQALLTHALALVREGNLRKAQALGFSDDELRALRRLRASDVDSLVCAGHVLARFSVDHSVLQAVLSRLDNDQDRESLIDHCLQLGASVNMMGAFFGMTANDCSARRQLLGIAPRQGRLAMPPEEKEHDAWQRWQEIAHDPGDTEDIQGMATLAEETGIPLAVLWHLIKQWAEPDAPRSASPVEDWVREGVV